MLFKTIKSVDSIVPYNDYGEPSNTSIEGDCEARSLRFNQLTGKDMDFGMVFYRVKNIPPYRPYHLPNTYFMPVYTYHCWNEDERYIYDSDRQFNIVENITDDLFDSGRPTSLVDKNAVIFDIEYFTPIVKNIKNAHSFNKTFRKLLTPYLKKAEKLDVDFVYLSGLSVKISPKDYDLYFERKGDCPMNFKLIDTKFYNECMDYRELQIEKYLEKNQELVY